MHKSVYFDSDRGLALLKDIGSVKVNGRKLSDLTIDGGYNIWQTYRFTVFLGDIKDFLSGVVKPDHGKGVNIKDIIGYAAIMAVSAYAVVKLWLFRPKLLIYSVDKANGAHGNDFRMDGVYDFLSKRGVGYIELFHTLLGRQFFKNLLKRRRSGIYLKAIDAVFYLTRPFVKKAVVEVDEEDLMRFPEDERHLVRRVASSCFHRAALSSFRVRFLRRLFSSSSIKAFSTIDDSRNYAEILVACNGLNIPHRGVSAWHIFQLFHRLSLVRRLPRPGYRSRPSLGHQ